MGASISTPITRVEYRTSPEMQQKLTHLEQELQKATSGGQQCQRQQNELLDQIKKQQVLIEQQKREFDRQQELQQELLKKQEEMKKSVINEQIRFGIIGHQLMQTFGDTNTLLALGFDKKNLNIAVIGRVSSGKSCIINIFLRKSGGEKAKVGHNETTLVPSAYDCKEFVNFKLWDFPGAGGVEFDYCKEENRKYIYLLSRMDIIAIVFDGMFDVSSRQTFNFVKEMPNKKIFLYNKADLVLDSIQYDREVEEKEARTLLQMEGEFYAKCAACTDFFLISAHNVHQNRISLSNCNLDLFDWKRLENCIGTIYKDYVRFSFFKKFLFFLKRFSTPPFCKFV